MNCFQSLTKAFFLTLCLSHAATASDEIRDYFVFLTTGKSTQGIGADAIQQKQAAHLDNFGRLAKLGSLTAAGPCADPDKKTRGIVVIHANSINDAESKFAPDPYVSEGFMKAELHPFKTIAGKLQLILEVTSMEQSVIVILSRGPKWTEKKPQAESIESKLVDFAKKQFNEGKLGFAAQFNGQSNNESERIAVMIFRGKEIDSVKATLESMDLVHGELVNFQAFPQYMAKGALAE